MIAENWVYSTWLVYLVRVWVRKHAEGEEVPNWEVYVMWGRIVTCNEERGVSNAVLLGSVTSTRSYPYQTTQGMVDKHFSHNWSHTLDYSVPQPSSRLQCHVEHWKLFERFNRVGKKVEHKPSHILNLNKSLKSPSIYSDKSTFIFTNLQYFATHVY